MSGIRITCRVRVSPGAEGRFLNFVGCLQDVVLQEGLKDTTLYEYFLGSEPSPRSCYIHEAYRDADSFARHMANIKHLTTGMDELFEVEALDICGPLPQGVLDHFNELYGDRFRSYPTFVSPSANP